MGPRPAGLFWIWLLCLGLSWGLPAIAAAAEARPDPRVLDSFEDTSKWTPGLKPNGLIVMDGRRSAEWTNVTSVPVVSISRVPADWSDYQYLGMWMWLRRPIEATITVTVDTSDAASGRTGQYVRDIPLSFSGWRYQKISRSAFGAIGDPAGWDHVRALSLSFTGTDDASEPASICLDRFTLTNSPFTNEMSDVELLRAVDWDYPGLEAAKAAYESGEIVAARDALIAHLRSRVAPVYLTPPQYADPVAEALPMMSNMFTFWGVSAQLDDDVDWTVIPPLADREWRNQLNRQRYFNVFGNAYQSTGEESYAAKLVAMMNDFADENPAPDFVAGYNYAWRPFEAGRRMSASWMYLPEYLNHSPSLDTASYDRYLKCVWRHGDYLYKFQISSWNNQRAVAANGLAHAAFRYPEFVNASAWRYAALNRLSDILAGQVLPDGAQFELSPAYHQLVLESAEEPFMLAQANGVALPAGYSDRLEKLFDYDMYVVQPNRRLPSLNDSDTFGGARRMETYLARGAELFGRRDMAWVATEGATGTPPKHISHAFKYAGQYVMRSGWGGDAQYLIFDAGPYGALHQHEDKLSFSLFSGGRNQLVDSGRYRYARDAWRGYFAGSPGHNTVVVDGLSQHRGGVPAYLRPPTRPLNNPWVTTGAFDYAAGVYSSGYGPRRNRSVSHRRSILYVKPDYFVVSDLLEGTGRHSGKLLFHFAGTRSLLSSKSKMAVSDDSGAANIAVIPADPSLVSAHRYTGHTTPIQGWTSNSYGEKSPATTVTYFRRGNLPFGFDTALVPRSADGTPVASATRLPVSKLVRRPGWRRAHMRAVAPARASALSIRWGDFRDHFLLVREGDGTLFFGGNSTNARTALVRMGGRRQPMRLILRAGSYFTRRGVLMASTDSRVEYLTVDAQDARDLKVVVHPSVGLRLYAPQAKTVTVNGSARAFLRRGDYITIR